MNDQDAAKAFTALGNEHRVAILRLLVRAGADGLNVTALREALAIPASTMAHHLRILVEGGLVEQALDGRELISRAAYGRIRALNTFLMKDCCKGAFAGGRAA